MIHGQLRILPDVFEVRAGFFSGVMFSTSFFDKLILRGSVIGVGFCAFLILGGTVLNNHALPYARIIDTFGPNIPPAMQGEVKSAVDSLDYLRTVNNISWTFFSPAGNIRPGTRTGKFRLGTETLVVDEKGQSAISMEDYAVAMLDEVERPQHVNGRFTVGY